MANLLLIILVAELVVQLVSTIGVATINDLVWRIVLAFPTALSRSYVEQCAQQKEYLKVRSQMIGTSSQDEFAKWAKLRRKHDKLLEDLEKKRKSNNASRAKFDSFLTTARLVSIKGLQWFLPFWYAREPMFWLPRGWFPHYVEWFASFPRAPLGSVSIVVWQWACTAVLVMLIETLGCAAAMVAAARGEKTRNRR